MDFLVYGKPIGKQRPRFSRLSHSVYTPDKTVKYEQRIAEAYTAAGGKCIPDDCYVCVSVSAFFPVPKSYSKVKRKACIDGDIRPDKKPDVDNVLKVVLDALNGLAYEDDKQVIEALCRKYYTDGEGYLWVVVKSVGDKP